MVSPEFYTRFLHKFSPPLLARHVCGTLLCGYPQMDSCLFPLLPPIKKYLCLESHVVYVNTMIETLLGYHGHPSVGDLTAPSTKQ